MILTTNGWLQRKYSKKNQSEAIKKSGMEILTEKFLKFMMLFILLALIFSVIANAKVDQINPKKERPVKN